MRAAVRELVDCHGLVLSDNQSQETIDWVVELTDRFDSAATDEEAVALLELLSRSDDLFYGVAFTILHFIESAPNWPNWPELQNTKGEWADILRIRLSNAGIVPPI